ncbi:MAG: hypothetical protein HMLKMBBP_02780 [Planctomycetes bacterium]|nr:hypothetical protein [Planctomycetota bacterium]
MTTPDPAPRTAYRVLAPRLEIRCYEPADAQALVDAMAAGVEHMRPFLPFAEHEPQTFEEKVALIRGFRGKFDKDEDYVMGAFDRAAPGHLVGGTGIHFRIGPGAAEIGYWVRAGEERRGIATEMAAAMSRVGFDVLGLRKMAIHCMTSNAASARVAEKLGYRLEGTIRASLAAPGKIMADRFVFGMLRDEFAASPAAAVPVEAFDVLGRRIG